MKKLACLAMATFVALPALAQVPAELLTGTPSGQSTVAKALARDQAKDFGTNSFYTSLDSFGMHPNDNGFIPQRSSTTGLFCTGASTDSRAVGQVNLPHGVDIEFLRVWGTDNSAGGDLLVTLQSACLPDFGPAVPTLTTLSTVTSTGSPGTFSDATSLPGTVLSDNQSCSYQVTVRFGNTTTTCDTSLFFYKARVQWSRFIPVAPATASFPNDVPTTAQFFREIEALADTGITAGCATGSFCPDQPVTRRQMAAFLARALGLPPATIVDPANP